MNGRRIIIAAVTALILGNMALLRAEDGKQLLELRKYTFASAEKREAFEGFLKTAAIPALNKAGIKPVGAFKLLAADNPKMKMKGDAANELYVLVPHASTQSLLGLQYGLDGDKAYRNAGAGILDSAKKDPAYSRIESSLFLAFDGIPKVEVPTMAESRILQLRIYESHNADRALRKKEMFDDGGELALFREVGMDPVFFGQAIAGTLLPNLTYMLSFENEEAKKESWDTFLKHPTWDKLKKDPKYKDTVSRITNLMLRPVDGSQI
jgi:hypothetical protein